MKKDTFPTGNVKQSEVEQLGDAQGKLHKRGQLNEEQPLEQPLKMKKLRRDGVTPCGRYMLRHQFAIMTVERWTLSAER